MVSLKRFYFNLAAGFAMLTRNKDELEKTEDGLMISSRVSRDVDHYRTHFFNL